MGPQRPSLFPWDPGRGGGQSRVSRAGVKSPRKNKVSSERSAGRPRTEGTLAPTQSEGPPAPDPHSCSISCHTGCDLSWACGALPGGEGAPSSPQECPNNGCAGPEAQTGNRPRAPPKCPGPAGTSARTTVAGWSEPRPRASLSGAAAEMLMFAGSGQGHGRNPEALRGVSLHGKAGPQRRLCARGRKALGALLSPAWGAFEAPRLGCFCLPQDLVLKAFRTCLPNMLRWCFGS